MKYSIQKLKMDDLDMLNKITVCSKQFWGYPQEWIDHWKQDLTVTRQDLLTHFGLKIIIEQEILGFCLIEHKKEEEYEIIHFWILPEYIGQGFGKHLLKDALDQLAPKKNVSVTVVADPNAEGFYRKQGFVTVGRMESYPEGRFLPVMKKNGC